jgi:dihydrolipoamide dehydrogenase
VVPAGLVLLSTGPIPFTEGLSLERVGVRVEKRTVVVDGGMGTNGKRVYTAGDVTGSHELAQIASHEREVAVEHALGLNRAMDYRAAPNCVFTVPEFAGVGLVEQEVKKRGGVPHEKSSFPLTASGQALAIGQPGEVVKMICEEDSGKVLGLHIIGLHASELIAEGALAIQLGATAEDNARAIDVRPNLPESVTEAAMGQGEGSAHDMT